jgi:hypothetical protein
VLARHAQGQKESLMSYERDAFLLAAFLLVEESRVGGVDVRGADQNPHLERFVEQFAGGARVGVFATKGGPSQWAVL